MFYNYFKIALRSLYKNRLFSFINIFGLALSMSVCMMIILRTKDQLDYDRFHPHISATYRIVTQVTGKKDDPYLLASTPLPLRERLSDSQQIVRATTVYTAIHNDASYGDRSIKVQGAFTEPSFFGMFGFRLAEGSEEKALLQPYSMVLSNTAARKLFGDADPLGKSVTLDKLGDYLVTGILEEPPGKSHLDFDLYVSSSTIAVLERSGALPVQSAEWNPFQPSYTYVQVRNKAAKNFLLQQLAGLSAASNRNAQENHFAFELQHLSDITPGTDRMYNDLARGAGWTKIITEISIALLILVAGCFNYTNLTIARALTRAKEVGIRKVAGARRSQIFAQYMVESICIALLAMGAAYIILAFILEYKPFNDAYEFMPAVEIDVRVGVLFLVFTLLTGALAGAVPAWILSSFKPAEVLKKIHTRKLFGNVTLQKSLVVFQFSLSLIILIFLSSFYLQFSHLSKVETGFRTQHVLSIPLEGADHQVLASEISRISGVVRTSAVSENFGKRPAGTANVSGTAAKEPVRMNYFFGDENLVPVMDLRLLAGSNFPQTAGTLEHFVLINEAAVHSLAFSSNAAAVGQVIHVDDTTELEIRGVLKDFYYQGTGNRIAPLLLRKKEAYQFLNILVNTPDENRVAEEVQSVFKHLYPHKPFSHVWLAKQLAEMNNQTATLSLLGFLGLVTLTIGCLGLLGLVVYTVETRKKEISIRKIIGAQVQQIVVLLSKDFVRLLLISGLISLPIGYILSFFFLQNFANRVHFGLLQLLLCFLFLLGLGLFTIISQTWKVAASNPADNLRLE